MVVLTLKEVVRERGVRRRSDTDLSHPRRRSALAVAIASALSGATMITAMPAWAESENTLTEIVVTARKRTESAQDVPQSIDVFSKDQIENLDIQQFEDYANRSASISYVSIGPGTQYFFMRGVSDGSNSWTSNNSTTGMFLDDLNLSFKGIIPDLHMYDIERIEVLNGPQGTLYGAGSMSGAVRVITNKPDPSGFSAGTDADVGRFNNGQMSNTEEAFLNLPLVPGTSAIRVVGFYVDQGGFIDNLLTTRHWVNGVTSTDAEWAGNDYNTQRNLGGRVEVLQKFSDNWQILLEANDQRQRYKGAWDQDVQQYGIDQVSRFGPENGSFYNLDTQAKLEGDVGIADLVYIAGFFDQSSHRVSEYSEYMQYANVPAVGLTANWLQGFTCQTAPGYSANNAFTGCNVPYMYYDYPTDTKRWSNEIRLASKGEGSTHWLVGAYEERTTQWYSEFYDEPGIDYSGDEAQYYICNSNLGGNPCPKNAAGKPIYPPGVNPPPGEWWSDAARDDEHQYAIFGELDQKLSSKITLTVGGRWFESRVSGQHSYEGYFWQPRMPGPADAATFRKNTFKAGLSYESSPGWMYYFLFGQGFREGGFNVGYPPQVPATFQPDTLNSYEVGLKSMWAGGKVRWNTAAYYMPWKDFQTVIYDPAVTTIGQFNANVGDARVYGAETTLEVRPTQRLTLTTSATYNDSRLTSIQSFLNSSEQSSFPLAVGERLPYVPYLKATASARYQWPIAPNVSGYVQFDESHTGSMWSSLDLAPSSTTGLLQRYLQPAYNLGTLRFGVSSIEGTSGVEGYVNNISDTHADIYTNTANFDVRETTNPPRMFGIRLKYRFGKKS
jgi:iron complex outermembrane recepter protein